MGRQVGAVLGISVLVAVLAGGTTTDFRHAWWVVAGISLAGAVTALRTSPASTPPARLPHPDTDAREALVDEGLAELRDH
jgi:hypothetical protein